MHFVNLDHFLIAQSQPGFLDFVVIPLYRSMVECLPETKEALDILESNRENWKNYQETEEDKVVYRKKSVKRTTTPSSK